MVYGAGGLPADFSPEARAYIQLSQAVMGSVIVGWFVLVAWVVRSPLAAGVPGAWAALVRHCWRGSCRTPRTRCSAATGPTPC
jgi:hypothetical protein